MKEKYWTLIFVVIASSLAYFFLHSKIDVVVIIAILAFVLFLAFKKNI